METTRFSDEEARAALTNMMMYTNEFANAELGAKLAMDMSIRTGQDLSTTTRLIGMAMTGNVEILGRYLPQLRNLDAVLGSDATMTEKAAYALKVLQEKFGGTAQADLDTYSGKVKQFSNAWNELKENIGTAFLPVLKEVFDVLTKIMKSFQGFKPESASMEILDATIAKFRARMEELQGILVQPGLVAAQKTMIENQIRALEESILRLETVKGKRVTEGKPTGGAKDVIPEDYSAIIKKGADESAKAWGDAAQEELDALEKMFKESANKQIEIDKWKLERILEGEKEFETEVVDAWKYATDVQGELEREALEKAKESQQKILEAHLQAATIAIESKINQVNTEYELGNISTETQLIQLKNLLSQKYELELMTFEKIMALWRQYPEKWQEFQNKITVATAKHGKDIQSAENKASLEFANSWKRTFDSIAQSIQINWMAVIKGTQSLRDQMTNIGENIANNMINAWIRMITEQIALETVAAITGRALSKETSLTKIGNAAATAAAKAYEAAQDYPAPLNIIMGVIYAAVVFAAVLAFGSSVSAAGGWDVDKDSLAYIHKNEMVLPAGIAEGFRNIIAGGGAGTGAVAVTGGGGGEQRIIVNNRFQGWDSTDIRRMIVKHGPTMYGTLKNRGRRYGIK